VPGGAVDAADEDDVDDLAALDDEDEGHGPDTDPGSGAAEAIFARLRADEADDEPSGADASGGEAEQTAEVVRLGVAGRDDAAGSAAEQAPDGTPVAEAAGPRPDAAWLDARDEVLTSLERAVTRRLKRVLTDHENTVRDAVRRHRKGSLPVEVVGDAGELRRTVAAALSAEVTKVVAAGAAFHDDPDHGEPVDAAAVAAGVLDTSAAAVVDPLHGKLTAAVEGHGSSDSVDELDAALRSMFREWRNDRVPELAGDVVTAAFNEGIVRAARSGAEHRWVIDDGGVPNPDAEDNRLAGAVASGEEFPTGDVRPPAHPGCRCLLVPAHR
jgi:hypothetical protein